MTIKLTDSNFVLYAAKHYDTVNCLSVEEFHEDLNRIKYIRKLFKKYENGEPLKERLILNHINVIYNCFSLEAATNMLCFKCKDQLHYLKPFLLFLHYWPEIVPDIFEKTILGSDVPMDKGIVEVLRKI